MGILSLTSKKEHSRMNPRRQPETNNIVIPAEAGIQRFITSIWFVDAGSSPA
jgi:hypothetical protein